MSIKVVDCGVIKASTSIEWLDRIAVITESIKQLVIKNEIVNVVIEDVQCQGGMRGILTFKKLAQLQGHLYGTLVNMGCRVSIMHSSTWKSSVGVGKTNRDTEKKSAQRIVQSLYDLKVNSDIADAICIGTAYLKASDTGTLVLAADQASSCGWAIMEKE